MAKAFRSLRLNVTALHALHVLGGGTCACPACASSELKAAGAPEPPDMVAMIRKVRTAPALATIDRNQAPPPPDMVAIILKQGDRQ